MFMGDDGGLRVRKKLATREALAMAATRLALERGLENVRVEDIAAEVNVSRRTFANYFSGKEEAIASLNVERAIRTAEALRARPAGESLADALVEAFVRQYETGIDPDIERIRLLVSAPALRGEYLKTLVAAERPLAAAIAARTGADPERDLSPRVLAAAVSAAARVALQHWVFSGGAERLPVLLRRAVAEVLGHTSGPSDVDYAERAATEARG